MARPRGAAAATVLLAFVSVTAVRLSVVGAAINFDYGDNEMLPPFTYDVVVDGPRIGLQLDPDTLEVSFQVLFAAIRGARCALVHPRRLPVLYFVDVNDCKGTGAGFLPRLGSPRLRPRRRSCRGLRCHAYSRLAVFACRRIASDVPCLGLWCPHRSLLLTGRRWAARPAPARAGWSRAATSWWRSTASRWPT